MRGKSLVLLALYFLAMTGAVGALMLLPPWLPDLITEEGQRVDSLFWAFVWLSVVILALVMAVVVYTVVHFRARPGDLADGEPIHGHHKLEVAWTAAFFLIVSVISFVSYQVLLDNEAAPTKSTNVVDVEVRGYQFAWSFDYPKLGVKEAPELVLPKGSLIRFRIRAEVPGNPTKPDVIHSFWVPEARIKQDAVPGLWTKTQWTPNKTGTWDVVCAELCGSNHNAMRAKVKVQSDSDFKAWVKEQTEPEKSETEEKDAEA